MSYTVERVCAWCADHIGWVAGFDTPGKTHGICQSCYDVQFPRGAVEPDPSPSLQHIPRDPAPRDLHSDWITAKRNGSATCSSVEFDESGVPEDMVFRADFFVGVFWGLVATALGWGLAALAMLCLGV